MKRRLKLPTVVGAIGAQISQAVASFALMMLAARFLGIDELGKFSILYGTVILATAVSSGMVGDSLTVLDRHEAPIRSALLRFIVIICLGTALVAAAISLVTGFLDSTSALLFAAAMIIYMMEDVLRRLLMANLQFIRIMFVDLASLVVSLMTLTIWHFVGHHADVGAGSSAKESVLTLSAFLAALALGQLAATITAILILPSDERYLGKKPSNYLAVFRYGRWRAAQQSLRPGMQTLSRISVVGLVSLAAAGQFEIARIYAAPAMLVVGGISSFLFASFARQRDIKSSSLLRQADKGVLVLLAVTIPGAAVAVLALPWAGPLLTGQVPNIVAAAGWFAYGVSTAAVTPYGALGAVRTNPAYIFAIRLCDTLVSLVSVALVLAITRNFEWAAGAMVFGSLLGGLAIRRLIVVSARRESRPSEVENGGVNQVQSGLRVL